MVPKSVFSQMVPSVPKYVKDEIIWSPMAELYVEYVAEVRPL